MHTMKFFVYILAVFSYFPPLCLGFKPLLKRTCIHTSQYFCNQVKPQTIQQHHQAHVLKSFFGSSEGPGQDNRSLSRVLIESGLWLGLVGYVFLGAPGRNDPMVAASDMDMIIEIVVRNASHPNINPIFAFIFFYLGALPLVYATLLLPAADKQKPLPALPFVVTSLFLGYFSLGPYIALRENRFQVSNEGFVNKFLTGKLIFFPVAGYILYIIKIFFSYDIGPETITEYKELFSTSLLVHVSSIDCAIQSLVVIDPVIEDMKRREWFSDGNVKDVLKAAFFATPIIGPPLYLLCRPALNKENPI